MKTLETKLGYQFQNPKLLDHALTHSSYANEHHLGSISSNERLEFLGDSVLGMIVADHLYRTFPDLPEGDLTRIRANLVCEGSLVLVAKEWDLGRYLKLGKGENACGGRSRPSILADTVEAVLAAVFLDGGLAHDRDIIQRFLLDRMEQVNRASRDHKTYLQELVQRKSGQVLSYELIGESGPDHNKTFQMQVLLNSQPIGQGTGHSKKEAEQAAANAAIERLEGK
ncbi:MAG: ribonuclease III [Eubacteriales bacterium]|nr:ribonuclease III [Eubacteriales bacterium]